MLTLDRAELDRPAIPIIRCAAVGAMARRHRRRRSLGSARALGHAHRQPMSRSVFSSAADFLRSLHREVPEVLLADLCLPGIDGLQLQAMLQERGRHFPVVFLSGHGDVPISVQAVRNGAVDFLVKPCTEKTLLRSLEYAIGIARRVEGQDPKLQNLSAAYRSLTNRERVVFGWVVTGRLNKQIASAIGTVEKTVKVHRARVMTKMGAALARRPRSHVRHPLRRGHHHAAGLQHAGNVAAWWRSGARLAHTARSATRALARRIHNSPIVRGNHGPIVQWASSPSFARLRCPAVGT